MIRFVLACSLVCFVFCVDDAIVVDETLVLDRDELAVRCADWLGWVLRCNGFSLKEICDDGDTTLFNGLLCAVGEPLGCEVVRLVQSSDGCFWRSLCRTFGNLGQPCSFSCDMSMGVLFYLAIIGDRDVVQRWLGWIDGNRSCLLERSWGGCLVCGFHRVCRDDVNVICTITLGLWALMGKVWDHLGLFRHGEMNRWVGVDIDLAVLEVTFAEFGYQLHLKGVAIFFKEVFGVQRIWRLEIVRDIGDRQLVNPFFRYLWQGPSDEVVVDVLVLCPVLGNPLVIHFQWAWERADEFEVWRESMGWDCVFFANLLF